AVHDVAIAAFVGVLAAVFGIILMRGVAACEKLFTRLKIKPAIRPMIGGALVGLLAIFSPQVMSSGHGALHLTGIFKLPIVTIALIFVLRRSHRLSRSAPGSAADFSLLRCCSARSAGNYSRLVSARSCRACTSIPIPTRLSACARFRSRGLGGPRPVPS